MLLFSNPDFLFYFFVYTIGNSRLKSGSDPAGLSRLFEAGGVSADVRSSARHLAGSVKRDFSLGASYYSEKLVFREMLAAACAFSGWLLFLFHHYLTP